MNCNVARDLIPLYADGLCEKETRHELEEHLRDCDDCRNMAEEAKTGLDTRLKIKTDNEIKPFKKINKKARRSKIISVTVISVLSAVIIALGLMIYSQIVKSDKIPNFEKIQWYYDSEKKIRQLLDGDIDGFLKGNVISENCVYEKFHDKELLEAKYNKYIKGHKFEIRCQPVYYTGSGYENLGEGQSDQAVYLASQIWLTSDNLGDICIILYRYNSGGVFDIEASTDDHNNKAANDFVQALSYVCSCKADADSSFDQFMAENILVKEQPCSNDYFKDGFKERAEEITADGSEILSCIPSQRVFDEDNRTETFSYFVEIKDKDGNKALLKQQVYVDYKNKYTAVPGAAEIYGNISDYKKEQLLSLF